jgi:RNA polymerase sigma-70 factor, ECF subfamily
LECYSRQGFSQQLAFKTKKIYKFDVLDVYQVDSVTNDQQNGWCEALYQAKAAGLLLYGRALGLSHGESEDVLQETFLALMQRAEAPGNPEHYCVRCFRNRALNYHRSLWRRLTRELESKRWFERSPGESPQEKEAMRCLAQLPTEQREVIVLKIWQEYTFEQIGELLGISPNTAAGRYRYGIQKLKVCLKEASYEHGTFRESFALLGATPPLSET